MLKRRGDRRLIHLCLLLGFVLGICSCASTRTLEVGDGSTIQHNFHPTVGVPMPIDNELVRVIGIGPALGPGKAPNQKRAYIWMGVLLAIKSDSISEISITDVSGREFVKLVDDKQPVFKLSRWGRHSKKIPATRESVPWLTQEEDTLQIFRFDLREKNGHTTTFYQPLLIRSANKLEMMQVIAEIEQGT